MPSKAKSTGKPDKRSVTSAQNVRKAQAIKAKRQSAESKAIAEYKRKVRAGEVKVIKENEDAETDELPEETPKLVKTKKSKKKVIDESESDTSSSDEELVIKSRRIKKDKTPKRPKEQSSYVDELNELREKVLLLEQTKIQRKPRAPRRKIEEPQPIQQQQLQPIINIHNPAPVQIEKASEQVKHMKESLLRFD